MEMKYYKLVSRNVMILFNEIESLIIIGQNVTKSSNWNFKILKQLIQSGWKDQRKKSQNLINRKVWKAEDCRELICNYN